MRRKYNLTDKQIYTTQGIGQRGRNHIDGDVMTSDVHRLRYTAAGYILDAYF